MSSVGYGDSVSMPIGLIYNQSPTADDVTKNWPIVSELAYWTSFILFG